jgi:ArsR family transcriptional regulator
MAVTKPEAFDVDDVRLAAWAKALAHPARVAILRVLAARDTCICGEIVDELPLAQATVSQHLKALRGGGLIEGEVEGPRVCYCLDQEALRHVRQAFDELFEGLDQASCC